MTETINRVLRAKATEWGWRLLLMVLTTIIGIMVAQGNAIQAAKDESANRRISGVEAAISDLLDLREQVALLNDQMARGRALREAFEAIGGDEEPRGTESYSVDLKGLERQFDRVWMPLPLLPTPSGPPSGP